MTGDGFVVGGGFQAGAEPGRARVEVRERQPVDAGLRAIGRGRGVVGGGTLFGEGGLAFHGDRRLGAQVEHVGGAALGVVHEGFDLGDECLARVGLGGRVQLRIQLFDARLDRTVLVAQLLEYRLNFRLEVGDLAQSDGVDLGRGQLGGGERSQVVRIVRRTLRQAPHAGVVGRMRQLFREQGPDAGIGGDDMGPHFVQGEGLQIAARLRCDGGVEGGDPFDEGGDEDVVGGLHGDEAVELLDHALEDKARRDDPGGRGGLGLGDTLVNARGHQREAGEVVLRIARIPDRVDGGEEVDQAEVQTAELLEDKALRGELGARHGVLQRPLDHSRGRPLRGGERGFGIGREGGEALAGEGGALLRGLDAKRLAEGATECQLAVEGVLLGAGEVLGAGSELGVLLHPLGGELLGPLVEGRRGGAEGGHDEGKQSNTKDKEAGFHGKRSRRVSGGRRHAPGEEGRVGTQPAGWPIGNAAFSDGRRPAGPESPRVFVGHREDVIERDVIGGFPCLRA